MADEIEDLKRAEFQESSELKIDGLDTVPEEDSLSVQGEPTQGREKDRGSWIVGAVLVALGLLFLASNLLPGSFIANWWAVFILIPALYNLNRAWWSYRQSGRLTAGGRSSLVGGLLILTVALIFLFGLDWGIVWPVFIIIIGLGLLLQFAAR